MSLTLTLTLTLTLGLSRYSGDEYEDAYLYSYYYGGEEAPSEPGPRTGSADAWELLGKLSSTLEDFRQTAADSPRDGS